MTATSFIKFTHRVVVEVNRHYNAVGDGSTLFVCYDGYNREICTLTKTTSGWRMEDSNTKEVIDLVDASVEVVKYEPKNGNELLEFIQAHCNEDLNCSGRMYMQITEHITRLMDEHTALKHRIRCVLDGQRTYEPQNYKIVKKPNSR